jgi:2-methylcitrate dehydratase PrpD
MMCGRPSPEDAAIEQDLLAAAADVLGAMNASDREAIAEALTGQRGAGPTLRKRLSRALERMRAEWRRRYE